LDPPVGSLEETAGAAVAPSGADGPRPGVRAAAAAAWLVPLAYLAWRFGGPAPARQTTARLALLAATTLLPAVTAWVSAGVRTGRERAGWRLLGAAWGALAASQASSALAFTGVGSPAAAIGLAQLLAHAFYPLAFAGFLALAALPRDGARLGRLLLDVALTLVAVHAIAWHLVLRHLAGRDGTGLHLPVLSADYVASLAVLLAALVALHRRPGEPAGAGLRLAVLGQFLLTLAALASVQAALAPGPGTAALRYGSFAAAAALTASGALLPARRRSVLREGPGELAATLLGDLPSVGLLAVAVPLAAEALRSDSLEGPLAGLALGAAALAALAALRTGLARRALEVELATRAEKEDRLREGQRLEALGHMAAAVAHDFNNLLAALQAAASELERHSPGSPELADIQACADRGAALCRQLVGLARRSPPAPREMDVRSVPEALARIVRRLLPPEVLLSVEVPPVPVPAVADPAQLEVALLNLAVNARDAMPDGGRLEIAVDLVEGGSPSGRPGGAAPPGRWARLSVRDTGTGMDAETLARAGEPFFTTKGEGKGTGLGLSTVDAIAHALGGRMVVESAPGKGTRVALLLPAARGACEVAAPSPLR
jgi:signal transduction histidine kinase